MMQQSSGAHDHTNRTVMAEFLEMLQRDARRRTKHSVESEEEEEVFYSKPGYPGEALFRFLNPRNPTRARLRVERLYWEMWGVVALSFMLSVLGAVLFVVGAGCIAMTEQRTRGAALVVVAIIMCTPGFYSLGIQWAYITCRKGSSLSKLPG